MKKKGVESIINIGAIHLQTIESELENIIGDYHSNSEAMLNFLNANERLIPYINTPLFLNLFLFSFDNLSKKEKEKIAVLTQEEFNTEMYHQFENGMYNLKLKKNDIPYKKTTLDEWKQIITNYLIKLSQKLGKRTNLFIEDIQPAWLGDKFKIYAYYFTSRIISGFFLSIAVGLLIARYNDFIGNGILASAFVAMLTIQLNNYEENRKKLKKGLTIFIYTFTLMVITGIYQGFSIKRADDDMTGAFSTTESLSGIVLGLFYGMIFGFRKCNQSKEKDIQPVELLDFNYKESLITGLRGGIVVGTFITVCALMIKIFGFSHTFLFWFEDIVKKYGAKMPNEYLAVIFIAFTVGGFLGFIIFALMGGRKEQTSLTEDARQSNKAYSLNYGIKRSLRNSFRFGVIVLFVVAGLYAIFIQFFSSRFLDFDPLRRAFDVGIGVALISCLWFGGFEFIQHWTLRYYLFIYGILPLKINHWVNTAQNLSFLKKIGASLQFLHPLIQDYYAKKTETVCEPYLKKRKRMINWGIPFLVIISILLIWPFVTRNFFYWHYPNEIVCLKKSGDLNVINDTTIVFQKTGLVSFSMRGKVHVGTFTGSVSARGTETGFMGFPLNKVYNIDTNNRHGALLYKFTNNNYGRWHTLADSLRNYTIGNQTVKCLTVNKNDTMHLCVNDIEYENNSGHFYVTMSFLESVENSNEKK